MPQPSSSKDSRVSVGTSGKYALKKRPEFQRQASVHVPLLFSTSFHDNPPCVQQISWAIELMYCIITFFAKTTLLLQLQRTFSPNRTGAIYVACQLLIYGNLSFYLGSFIALVVECVPQERIWNPLITTGRCIKTGDLLIAMGAINIVSDLMILILPIWTIFHLRISTKLKLGVSAVFATGVLAFTCSILRLAYTIPPLHSEDSTYLFAPVGLWS